MIITFHSNKDIFCSKVVINGDL